MKKTIFSTALLTVLLLAGCASLPQAEEQVALPELTIGTAVDAPYFYMGEDGEYTGLDKDIAVEACRRMGYSPAFKVFTWGEQDALLADGTLDCVWECFAMNGRTDLYQWAGPYLTDEEQIVVAADSDIHTLADLSGRIIAVRIDSKGEDYFLKEGGTAILADSRTELATFDDMTDAFSFFGKGYADAVAGHTASLRSFTEQNPALYRYLDESMMTLDLGVAFAKDYDHAFVAALQSTLEEMQADGTIAALAAQYGVETEKAGAAGGI